MTLFDEVQLSTWSVFFTFRKMSHRLTNIAAAREKRLGQTSNHFKKISNFVNPHKYAQMAEELFDLKLQMTENSTTNNIIDRCIAKLHQEIESATILYV